MTKIAKKFGIKPRTVELGLKKCGIRKEWGKKILGKAEMYKDKATLEWHLVDGMNASQIGKIYNQDASTILHWIQKHHIPYDAKKLGYERMIRNADLRAERKAERKAQKEAIRKAALKYPGRGKGRTVSVKTRLKHSVSGVFNGKKSETPEERMLRSILRELGYKFHSETPLAFFQDEKFVTAHRVDCYFPVGSLNKEYPVVLALDGVWHHKSKPNIEKRDRLLNTVAQHSGIIVARLWNDEIDLENREKNLKYVGRLLGAVARCKPGLVRFHVDSANTHSVRVTNRLERTASTTGLPRLQFKIMTEKNVPKIYDMIEKGDYIDLSRTATQALRLN